jgi:single-stranded DNA-binding protein
VCWPNTCEGPVNEVKHEDEIEVLGRLNQRKFTDKDGQNRSAFEIVAKTITIHPKQAKPLTPATTLEITDAPF